MSKKKTSSSQNFSIAQKYNKVKEILNEVPNMSEFICQAIEEKYEREKNKDLDMVNGISRDVLREEIMSVLNEFKLEDVFIVKGNVNAIDFSNLKTVQEESLHPIKPIEKKKNDIDDDLKNMIKGVVDDW